MRYKPEDLARAFYLATRDKTEKEAVEKTRRFFQLLQKKGLSGIFDDVLAVLPQIANKIDNRDEITIATAHAVDGETLKKILSMFSLDTNQIEITKKVIPELVGGVRLTRKDSVIDMTVKKKLDRLKERLIA